ncbi:MAG: ABC transporter ATP-binding protein [Hyphomicrobiales bacterium]|nr:ABC transporter ATP-binding protein [Hyphomicrobiales bacterium]
MTHIHLEAIEKSYGQTKVLNDCSLEVARGEVMTLLGPSGCGKTTLLRTLAGFVRQDHGRVVVGGVEISHLDPNRRSVGYVFQNYALFPHLSVADNVAYGLKVRRRPAGEIRERVAKALQLVALDGLGARYPAQLSGGQQQRVAIARVLVLEPEVLLLDEPFNALDAKLRLTMQIELRKLIDRVGITSIFVTHDQSEAMMLSDKVAVMRAGRIEQVAAPLEIYDRPVNDYVASFIGRANVLSVEVRDGVVASAPEVVTNRADGPARLIVRPENLAIAGADACWSGRILFASAQGPSIEYEVEAGLPEPLRLVVPRQAGEAALPAGSAVGVRIVDPGACIVIGGGSGV